MKNIEIEKDTRKLNGIKEASEIFFPQFKESLEWLTSFEFLDNYSFVITDEIVSQLKSVLNSIDNITSLLERMEKDVVEEKFIVVKGKK